MRLSETNGQWSSISLSFVLVCLIWFSFVSSGSFSSSAYNIFYILLHYYIIFILFCVQIVAFNWIIFLHIHFIYSTPQAAFHAQLTCIWNFQSKNKWKRERSKRSIKTRKIIIFANCKYYLLFVFKLINSYSAIFVNRFAFNFQLNFEKYSYRISINIWNDQQVGLPSVHIDIFLNNWILNHKKLNWITPNSKRGDQITIKYILTLPDF